MFGFVLLGGEYSPADCSSKRKLGNSAALEGVTGIMIGKGVTDPLVCGPTRTGW